MRKILVTLVVIAFISNVYSQDSTSTEFLVNEIEKSLIYQTGSIELPSGNAKVNIPEGFHFLDQEQSIYVLTDLWGNPVDSTTLGMIVPADRGVLADNGWAFIVSYEELGYVKDDDAEDINYDELLVEMQKETAAANPERVKLGYEPIAFLGWASAPFYDKDLKTLHWAQELKFGDTTLHTLNYNLRVLGRKGVYNLNAVASMNELPEVKESINKIIRCVEYTEGNKYSDFDSGTDNVAAWTIGGLVAGKVLAKVGFFAVLLKFWKIIALAVIGAGAGIWKYIKRKKESAEPEPEV